MKIIEPPTDIAASLPAAPRNAGGKAWAFKHLTLRTRREPPAEAHTLRARKRGELSRTDTDCGHNSPSPVRLLPFARTADGEVLETKFNVWPQKTRIFAAYGARTPSLALLQHWRDKK
jgi:hypothetical protein